MNENQSSNQTSQQPAMPNEPLQPSKIALTPSPQQACPVIRVPLSSARDINIATNLTVNNLGPQIYGHDPSAEQHKRLVSYLARLAASLHQLPLRGISAHLDAIPELSLAQTYVPLASTTVGAQIGAVSQSKLDDYFEVGADGLLLRTAYHPDWALPANAVIATEPPVAFEAPLSVPGVRLHRAQMLTEALRQHSRLVLLSEPGGGKSTFLRYLAWALARNGLGQQDDSTALVGWDDNASMLPVILPLRSLTARLYGDESAPATILAGLQAQLAHEYAVSHADELLDRALGSGTVLLLLDGLDEVPLRPSNGQPANRYAIVQAVHAFAERYPATRIVITCRTHAFGADLRKMLGWPTATIAPLTLGQIRHFANTWFTLLAEQGVLSPALAAVHAQTLVETSIANPRLRALAHNPLLLTMMVLVLTERRQLAHDRPLLYERILELLLGQWDAHKDGGNLAETIGHPSMHSEHLRTALDQFAFLAHTAAASSNDRAQLSVKDLRYLLADHFERMQIDGAWEAAGRCLTYFQERSGLLLSDDGGASYRFAHETLQEYGAGRHLLLQPNAIELVLQHRGDDRWREPITLGLGAIQHYPGIADRLDRVLTELIDPEERGAAKSKVQWYRDLVFAAELGAERGWSALRSIGVGSERLQRELRRGLIALLADKEQPLPVAERVQAGFLLGELGDRRFPTTLQEWQRAIDHAVAGQPGGYFCLLPMDNPQTRIWIAQFLITNAQMAEWEQQARVAPKRHAMNPNFNRPNQPASSISWYTASAFCTWLTAQTHTTIRLPNNAEWNLAAFGREQRRYPWGNRRENDRAVLKTDQDTRGCPYTVPVGCYPAGASALGVLDLIGNVWEWTNDLWERAVGEVEQSNAQTPRVLRGGGYHSTKRQALEISRIGLTPESCYANGFRIILEIPVE